jgi:hypothetical protein
MVRGENVKQKSHLKSDASLESVHIAVLLRSLKRLGRTYVGD